MILRVHEVVLYGNFCVWIILDHDKKETAYIELLEI